MSDEPNLTEGEAARIASERVEADRALIKNAEGLGGKLLAFTKLSGPGWLQSAITLGGGSLAGSLYLGVLAGYGAMFWQPLAMIMGVIMLSAIGFVTLSTGERPFDAINKHVNPVLGWGWAIATLMANLVWCMPQYGLGTGALRQNLFPGALGGDTSQWVAIGILFVVTGIVIVFYDAGGAMVKVFDWILKGMVGIVVISFFVVVARMTAAGDLEWGRIFAGFLPDFSVMWNVSPDFAPVLKETGEYAGYWTDYILREQRDAMISSAATAVGINMTFLLPYSMLRKGWDRDFRGLAIFDLSTGLFIPYLLATSCVVIASANAFHADPAPGLVPELAAEEEGRTKNPKLAGTFAKVLDGRLASEYADSGREEEWKTITAEQKKRDEYVAAQKKSLTDEGLTGDEIDERLKDDPKAAPGPLETLRAGLPLADRTVAAMVVRRDNADFANSLEQLSGAGAAQKIFGIGVLGMAVSTIIILMLINGFVLTEICNQPGNKALHLAGCFLASVVGAFGSVYLFTGDSKAYLAVPTSMFGMVLLPIAYATFFMMLNSKSLLGADRPEGGALLRWNVLMGLATAFATFCCLWSINSAGGSIFGVSARTFGFSALGVFIALAVAVHFARSSAKENGPN